MVGGGVVFVCEPFGEYILCENTLGKSFVCEHFGVEFMCVRENPLGMSFCV